MYINVKDGDVEVTQPCAPTAEVLAVMNRVLDLQAEMIKVQGGLLERIFSPIYQIDTATQRPIVTLGETVPNAHSSND